MSFDSFERALGVFGFILAPPGGLLWSDLGVVPVRWVHSGTPLRSSSSFVVVG